MIEKGIERSRPRLARPCLQDYRGGALAMVVAACVVLAGWRCAEAKTIMPAAQSLRIESRVQRESRTILVSTPDSFATTSHRYPVLFVLDGEDQFQHAASTAAFWSYIGQMPEIVVVGVTNNARLRDLSPPTDDPEEAALGTGGDGFLDFLEQELIPEIEKKYRGAPLRLLFGHSRGGLINIHALLTRPQVFRAHIAASPYFGWSHERILQQAERTLPESPGRHFLYITAGDAEADIRASVEKAADILERRAPRELTWKYEYLPGEDHGSTPLLTLYRGMREFFAGWAPAAAIDTGDVAEFERHFAGLSLDFGYEVIPSGTTFWLLQNALLEKHRAAEHLRLFERASDSYPSNHYLLDNLAEAYAQAGQRAQSKRAFVRADAAGRRSESAADRNARRQRMSELGL